MGASEQPTRPGLRLATLSIAAGLLVEPTAASAWTAKSQESIARAAAEIAPPDFARQIERHRKSFLDGVMAPFRDRDDSFHHKDSDGGGRLDEAIAQEVRRTIAAIWNHQPFAQIVYQAGVVSHYVADANNPLNTSSADPYEGHYFGDYLKYLESVEPRLQVVFYGLDENLEDRPGRLEAFVLQTLRRSRELYPLVGKEYRRIGWRTGQRYFDDRSTAFGVAAIAHSRAVSDVALVLRYIWIEAGGADWRPAPSATEGRLVVVPRPGPSR